MKLTVTLICLLFITNCFSQKDFKVPRLQKTALGKSGCFAYMPKGDLTCQLTYSIDSSEVYNCDISEGDFVYSVIVVKLKDTRLSTEEDKNDMLIDYLDFLQTNFSITESAGYGLGHTLNNYPEAVGILDYWKDSENNQWSVKGWADSSTIGIMMLQGPTDYPSFNVQQLFLDGFRFN